MNKYLLKGMTGNFIIWKAEVKAISAEDAVCVEDYKGAQAIMVTRLLGKGELLPCPFCGETEKVMIDPDHDGPFPDDYTVRCWQCGVYGARRDNQSDAILAWNTRANLEHTEIAQDNEGMEPDAPLMDKIQEYEDFFYELLEWLANGETEYKPQGGEAEDRIFLDKDYIQERAEKLLGDRVN